MGVFITTIKYYVILTFYYGVLALIFNIILLLSGNPINIISAFSIRAAGRLGSSVVTSKHFDVGTRVRISAQSYTNELGFFLTKNKTKQKSCPTRGE